MDSKTISWEDLSNDKVTYGVLPLIQSQTKSSREWTRINSLNESCEGNKVLIRARLQSTRAKGPLCFLTIRQQMHTVQAILEKSETVDQEMLSFVSNINVESIIDVEGIIQKAKVLATSVKDVEVKVSRVFVVSSAEPIPLHLADASRPKPVLQAQDAEVKAIAARLAEVEEKIKKQQEIVKKATEEGNKGAVKNAEKELKKLDREKQKLQKEKSSAVKYVKVKRETRLNNRIIDLRTPANQAIFRLQSAVCQLFREFLLNNEFMEIHSPKLIGAASEGGASVFKLQYFERWAYLAQSPQFYKQMGITGDFERVFEVGPVFRAENSFTHRHLCEFVGLDLEMSFYEHYHEVVDLMDKMFNFIFNGLEERFATELEIVQQQYPFTRFKHKYPSLRINYSEAVALLNEAGEKLGDFDDIGTMQEKKLGKIISEKYQTDFYIIDKFPAELRPFYSMKDPEDPRYANAYDFFIRGEEVLSGAQRVHDPAVLTQGAKEKKIDPETLKEYIDAFKYGSAPHAGGGIGLERVVMLYLGLNNIRLSSLFPRDPSRLSP